LYDVAMNDDHKSGGRHGWSAGAGWSVGIAGVLLLYALSPGPVAKLVHLRYGSSPPSAAWTPLKTAYAPLEKLAGEFKPVEQFYRWYFAAWGLPS
jgi:hypothetical protein